jgi:hypothetical protein
LFLGLAHLYVVHPGEHRFPLADRITAWPLVDLPALPAHLAALR